jgi:hypothetical protein
MKKAILLLMIAASALALNAQQAINVPSRFGSIQDAIDAAGNGDTVLVDDGIYQERIDFKGKAIHLASNFIIDGDESHIENTVIDGSQLEGYDESSTVNFISGEDTLSILQGFTVLGGNGSTYAWPVEEFLIGSAVCVIESGATIRDNIFRDCFLCDTTLTLSTGVVGSAVYAYSDYPDDFLIFERNQLINNHALSYNFTIGALFSRINARITENVFSGNLSESIGTSWAQAAAIQATPVPGIKIIFENNLLEDNVAKGLKCWGSTGWFDGHKFQFHNNTVINNKALSPTNASVYAGGILFTAPEENSVISGNYFYNNKGVDEEGNLVGRGGAISFDGEYEMPVLVTGNYFICDSADRGGAINTSNQPLECVNNVFSHCLARNGGAIYSTTGAFSPDENFLRVINCSFYDNTAIQYLGGGAIFTTSTRPLVFNSVFHGNSAPTGKDISTINTDTVFVHYSIIESDSIGGNALIGQGVFYEDPLFLGPDSLMIDEDSPCVDAGTEEVSCYGYIYNCPENCLCGNPRPIGEAVDIGAYEVDLIGFVPQISSNNKTITHYNYPDPCIDQTTIYFTLDKRQLVKIHLFDQRGNLVGLVKADLLNKGEHNVVLSLEGNSPGTYFYTIRTNQEMVSGKFIMINSKH